MKGEWGGSANTAPEVAFYCFADPRHLTSVSSRRFRSKWWRVGRGWVGGGEERVEGPRGGRALGLRLLWRREEEGDEEGKTNAWATCSRRSTARTRRWRRGRGGGGLLAVLCRGNGGSGGMACGCVEGSCAEGEAALCPGVVLPCRTAQNLSLRTCGCRVRAYRSELDATRGTIFNHMSFGVSKTV